MCLILPPLNCAAFSLRPGFFAPFASRYGAGLSVIPVGKETARVLSWC